jgi:hypothetical protein
MSVAATVMSSSPFKGTECDDRSSMKRTAIPASGLARRPFGLGEENVP